MLIADSHEFIELYRGDKDLRMGAEIVAIRDDIRFVSFAPDRPSPNDRDRFGIRRTHEGPIPALPDRMELRLLPSVAVRFRRKESGGIAALMPTIGREMRRLRPDVILENPFSWLTPRSYQTHAAAQALGVPMIYYDPGDDIRRSRKQDMLVPFERRIINDAACIITFNEAGKGRFVGKYGYPAERIRVIPKPVDVAAARYTGDVTECRRQAGADSPDTLVVGYVGRLTRAKGSAVLLDVARRAAETTELAGARFLFIGGALSSEQTDDEYRMPNTAVTGMVAHDDVAKFIACCDVIVFPDITRPGGFPTAVAEAMAAGKPLVLGIGAHTDYLPMTNGVDALLIDPSSPEAITEALLRLVRSPRLRHSLGDAVGAFAARRMDYPIVAREYLTIIEELVHG